MKILIADDHPIVRQGLKAMLETLPDITVVAEARNGQEAVDLARGLDWDVALVDYSMPGRSGVDLVKQIKQHWPDRPVLVLSMYPEDLHATQVIKAGAAGYVSKESPPEELALAIRKVASGGRYVSPTLAERMADELAAGAARPLHETLSDREYRVMRALAAGKQINEISQDLLLSPSTISTYRTRILRKLKLSNNAELVRYTVENRLTT